MVSMQDLVRFLWDLMRNDEARSRFEQDPDGTLDDCGLSGVTTRDIQDAQMVMQDRGIAHPAQGGSSSGGHSDPVDEIRHTSATYEVDRSIDYNNHQQFTVVDIDDRDTLVNDSYNGDTDVVAIQDNDTINDNDTVNADVDVIDVEDSFDDEQTEESAEDDSDQSTVDPSDPVLLPAPAPAPDPDADAEPDTELDECPEPDLEAECPDPEPPLDESDVETVDAESEELAAPVV